MTQDFVRLESKSPHLSLCKFASTEHEPSQMSVCLRVSSRYVASLSCGLTPLRESQNFIVVLCCDKPYSVFLLKLRFCLAELQILQLAELFAGSVRDGAVTRAVKPAKGIMGWRQFGILSQLIVVAYTTHGGSAAKTSPSCADNTASYVGYC